MKRTSSNAPLPNAQALARKAPAFRKALLDWYAVEHRRLPWRTDPSLYRTVVSEFMLQQTRIETALPYFERWMTALPDFNALAAASEERILKLWEGLGYYRRARNLHRLARELTASPEIPRTPEAWLRFPGIGPYSAAAITSIAFGASAACVDGNVVRVLGRLTGHNAPLKDASSAARLFQPLARRLLDETAPGTHNQAMMELGATACQRKPACERCPVAAFCRARRLGNAESIPLFPSKSAEKISVVRVWIESRGSLLLARPGREAKRLAELHELPACETVGLTPETVRQQGAFQLRKKRTITRFSITETVYRLTGFPVPTRSDLVWIPLGDLDQIPFSGPHRRWIETILQRR